MDKNTYKKNMKQTHREACVLAVYSRIMPNKLLFFLLLFIFARLPVFIQCIQTRTRLTQRKQNFFRFFASLLCIDLLRVFSLNRNKVNRLNLFNYSLQVHERMESIPSKMKNNTPIPISMENVSKR